MRDYLLEPLPEDYRLSRPFTEALRGLVYRAHGFVTEDGNDFLETGTISHEDRDSLRRAVVLLLDALDALPPKTS